MSGRAGCSWIYPRTTYMVFRWTGSIRPYPWCASAALLGASRSSLYYRPKAASAEDLFLMCESDRQYLETPFFGSGWMKAWLERRGVRVSQKRAAADALHGAVGHLPAAQH